MHEERKGEEKGRNRNRKTQEQRGKTERREEIYVRRKTVLRTQKNRENGITIYIKTLRVFFLHSSVFSFHLLCPSLSKYRPEVLFLSPSRPANHHHCRPASASPGHHFCSPFNPRAQPPSPVKKTEQPRRQPYRPVTSDAHFGHHRPPSPAPP